ESPGILKHWTELWGSERVTVAYGQGFAATPIQMVSAVNAIANDGTFVAPRLVDAIVGPDGEMIAAAPSATHEVIRPEVAGQMQYMMRQVVCRGTAKLAQEGVDNFSIAGKTGTGLKAQPNGTYLDASGNRVYYASFAGFFPAEDPQITVLVSIDEPPAGDINRFGGTAAAPVFADLVPTIVHELGIQPPAETMPCPG
ncbi:MAG TPA: penicillin-binding transpeptidase domain-containing protein, partial [Ilumatobacter sp.]|nr:penicillin-binding transpeptidase domain-containing protein [Ilumatobacter sp.]